MTREHKQTRISRRGIRKRILERMPKKTRVSETVYERIAASTDHEIDRIIHENQDTGLTTVMGWPI